MVFHMCCCRSDLVGLKGAGGVVHSALHGADGIGGLLAQQADFIPEFEDAPTFLYFHDGNGNVGQLVAFDAGVVSQDPPGATLPIFVGEPAARYEYDPYGGTLLADDPIELENPFRFSTKYYDTQPATAAAGERGMYYYGYRYYSPRLGRWMNRDPIGEDGDVLLTRSMNNTPLNVVDYRGLEAETTIKSIQSDKCSVCCEEWKTTIYHRVTQVGFAMPHSFKSRSGHVRTVSVEPEKRKNEACESIVGKQWVGILSTIYTEWRFKHSGPCEEPCNGRQRVPYWVCRRPLDYPGAGTSGGSHVYICCDAPNGNHCRGFWDNDQGPTGTRVSPEALTTGTCEKIMVCPDEHAEKCSGQNWRQPYNWIGYNCGDWSRDFGNVTCLSNP